MAASSLLALLDDIATILDDVATLTKVATKKTAGVLGDDLALNAQQVAGVTADRELPVVWAVGRGSLVNKAILVPVAVAVSAVASWAVTPLLMVGGTFLCFEGFEKIAHRLLHGRDEDEAHRATLARAVADADVDLVALEQAKIRGAVRTDFVLSAEIIAITLGAVATAPFPTRVAVLASIAVIMTVGVYGLVAGIVKLDDLGLHLSRRAGTNRLARAQRGLGTRILAAAPWLMKGISVAGTVAMFMVGGGILVHGIPALHHAREAVVHGLAGSSLPGRVLGALAPALLDATVGMLAGALALGATIALRRTFRKAAG